MVWGKSSEERLCFCFTVAQVCDGNGNSTSDIGIVNQWTCGEDVKWRNTPTQLTLNIHNLTVGILPTDQVLPGLQGAPYLRLAADGLLQGLHGELGLSLIHI